MSDETMMPVHEHLEVVRVLESRIQELEADLSALQHAHDQLRNVRWWETYNAAMSGYCARDFSFPAEATRHRMAAIQSTFAHGPLETTP